MGPKDNEPYQRYCPFISGIIFDMDTGYLFGNTKEEVEAAALKRKQNKEDI